jgi:hypothetical protein
MSNLAGTGSPTPYIKEEIDDMNFGQNRFMSHNGLDMQQQFGNQQFSGAQDNMSAINPSDLSMTGSFSMNNHFGGSASYIPGGAGIADDELADSLGNIDPQPAFGGFKQDNMEQQDSFFHGHPNGSTNANLNHLYSHTPDDLPIQSPFVQPQAFDFSQYQSTPQRIGFSQSMHNGAIPRQRMAAAMSRNGSDSRSPMSPKGASLGGHFGTPDSGNFGSQPIMANVHRRQKSVSGQWDNTPGSQHSWIDSPTQSPHAAALHHQQISEVIHSGKHASLPAKVDLGQSQDAKKRRRRESHNLVERRRRDNINERIHDLSRLVPQHRLEDEKIRKHINNNGPLSPAVSGMSPPQATSLLAGGTGKRAAGNITTGLPLEEKDKGPNKGDILNGAVSWTRDLMWMLARKLEQVDQMSERLRQLTGEEWPSEETEDERRMRTELLDAVSKNGSGTFKYSRTAGSGLRVPKHTTLAGEPLNEISPQSLSPGLQSNGSGSNTNSNSNNPQFWMNQQSGNSSNPFTLKEEDEYNSMDMG